MNHSAYLVRNNAVDYAAVLQKFGYWNIVDRPPEEPDVGRFNLLQKTNRPLDRQTVEELRRKMKRIGEISRDKRFESGRVYRGIGNRHVFCDAFPD